MQLPTIILIGLGGFIGAVSRFIISFCGMLLMPNMEKLWWTFVVNLIGCFLIGFCTIEIQEPHWRSFLITGYLGAFTTFSTFSLDAMQTFQTGFSMLAFSYLTLTVLLCLGAAYLGWWLALL